MANLITLSFVKENFYDVGEKIDFTLLSTIVDKTFKGTIHAICDYKYANTQVDLKSFWFNSYDIDDITDEDLYDEPFYLVTLHQDFDTLKKGDTLVLPQPFIDTKKTKDSEDETFAVYTEINLESNHAEFNVKEDVIEAINEFLESKNLKANIRLLKDYDERDLNSILESLRYFIKVDKTDKEVINSVINLLRNATQKEIIESKHHNRRYEVYFSTIESRTVICTPLIKFNRKDIKFKY